MRAELSKKCLAAAKPLFEASPEESAAVYEGCERVKRDAPYDDPDVINEHIGSCDECSQALAALLTFNAFSAHVRHH